ncbi:uncharacterized protein [Venturia canescens]|uniref:uncharacterized protein n=1 Tax=Venturia canescens TaxID=32260 RepID=UPI001C9BDDF0|nr:uncharacterized protein LOC122406972 [Venturia canescens]XP_043268790.1 uncharacterized protein LOC122406972 [Venturia canescens]XP_043268791.1 uncharacterized protein LOC122406972 [Venturia canescens]
MECPEAVERGRNFRLLADEELPECLNILTGYLPESLKFQQTLLTYMRDKVWEFSFYVADGWPEVPICLHFPGMTLSPHGLQYESFGVFCPGDRLDLLQLLRDEDILIDWTKPLYINFVHCDIANELVKLYEGTGNVEQVLGDVWACEEPENTIQVEEDTSDGESDVQVLPLKAEHAEGIHELYPANDMECHELFLRLIRTLPAAGVFADGSLAAWMIQSYYGAMFSMQTRPEYRRKGYGTRLARYLTKAVADRGYNPFVVIRPENEASQSLYRKLGFRMLYTTIRATFTPYDWEEPENEDCSIIRENLANAVRQLKVEQRVIDAFQIDEDATMRAENEDFDGEETIRDPSDSPKDEEEDGQSDEVAENGYEREDELLEPIEEQPEGRIGSSEENSAADASSDNNRTNEAESQEVNDSNEGDDGGTDVTSEQND